MADTSSSTDAVVKIPSEFKHCKECKTNIKVLATEVRGSHQNAFPIHIDVKIWSPAKSGRSETRRQKTKLKKLRELERLVSGLQNTEGGVVLIHLTGCSEPKEKYLGRFDKFFQDSSIILIGDNELYTNRYERDWLSNPDIPNASFIRLDVKKTNGVSTVDYNTSIRTDCANIKPYLGNITHVIQTLEQIQSDPDTESGTTIYSRCDTDQDTDSGTTILADSRHQQEDIPKTENRHIEVKCLPRHTDISECRQVAEYIWENLKLKKNVTSMSKVKDGGTVYVNVSTALKSLQGFDSRIQKLEHIATAVEKTINQQILVVDSKGEFKNDTRAIEELNLYDVGWTGSNPDCIKVSVKQWDGIVFYDRRGPRAYIINNGEVERMTCEDWYMKMKEFTLQH